MLTLLTQRIAYRLGTSLAVRGVARARVATTPIVLPSLTCRTYLTGTPHLSFPAGAAAVKKPAAKKTAASKAKANPKAKPKKKVSVKKKPVVKKNATKAAHPKVTKADMPPKAPPSIFVVFFTKYIKGLDHKPKGNSELPSLAKEAAVLWKSMGDVEKQPYKDELVALKAAYEINKKNYFDSVPDATLTEINRRRKLKGKPRIHGIVKDENRRPLTSFIRYLTDFRASSEGQSLIANLGGSRGATTCAVTAGRQWKTMTDAQKTPYIEASHKEMAAWKAKMTTHA